MWVAFHRTLDYLGHEMCTAVAVGLSENEKLTIALLLTQFKKEIFDLLGIFQDV